MVSKSSVFINISDNFFLIPFNSIKDIIEKINIKYGKQSIIIDIHGESTSEKMAIGHFFDGDVTAVFPLSHTNS